MGIDNRDRFKQENGEEWNVMLNPWGYVSYAYKTRPEETGLSLTEEEVIIKTENFMEKNSEYLGIEAFSFSNIHFTEYETHSLWTVGFEGETIGGEIPPQIYLVVLLTKDGQIYAIGDVDLIGTEIDEEDVDDIILEDEAIDSASEQVGNDESPAKTELETITEMGEKEPRKVWKITYDEPINKEVIVDAKTGEIINVRSTDLDFLNNPYLILGLIVIIIAIITTFLLKKRHRKKN
jgi:hypothetical protein